MRTVDDREYNETLRDVDGWPGPQLRGSRMRLEDTHVVGIEKHRAYSEEEEQKLHAEQSWFKYRDSRAGEN